MISYYDIRAACTAMHALQDKTLGARNLDFHFSNPKVWFIELLSVWLLLLLLLLMLPLCYSSILFLFWKDNPSQKDINQGTLVVFNLDLSVSNDDLHQICGAYGEVKEVPISYVYRLINLKCIFFSLG